MKKLISLALTLAILASLAISVSAKTVHVVGAHGENTGGISYNDGYALGSGTNEWSGNSTDSSASVDVTVTTGNYESRYAVDIEYGEITFNVTGNSLVWDVNQLKYVTKNGSGTLDAPDPQTISVKNYSDQPVTLAATANMYDDPADSIDLTDCPLTVVATVSKTQIAKAQAATATEAGKETVETVTISLEADKKTNGDPDWEAVATYFAPKLTSDGAKLKIATVSITVSKVS